MAKPNWEAIEQEYRAGNLSIRAIANEYGVSDTAIRKRARENGWKRESSHPVKGSHSKVRTKQTANQDKPIHGKVCKDGSQSDNAQNPSETKPEQSRIVVTNHPPFHKGNQYALKHGGYGRRMLLSDAISEDAQSLTLSDELFWLRAGNLTAAENVGRWKAELEDEPTEEKRKLLMSNIGAAYKAMHRNTARIESLERTISSIRVSESLAHVQVPKIEAETDFKKAATEKIREEGGGDEAVIIHNSLKMPGAQQD